MAAIAAVVRVEEKLYGREVVRAGTGRKISKNRWGGINASWDYDRDDGCGCRKVGPAEIGANGGFMAKPRGDCSCAFADVVGDGTHCRSFKCQRVAGPNPGPGLGVMRFMRVD